MDNRKPIRLPEAVPRPPAPPRVPALKKAYLTPHVLVPLFLFVFVVLPFGYHLLPERIIERGAGVFAPEAPIQTALDHPASFLHDGIAIQPLAGYDITARVLGKKEYRDDLVPMDLALGWQGMSDSANLNQIKITMINRFYLWETANFPLTRHDIETESANNHIIPATDAVRKELDRVRIGNIVHLKGFLVQTTGPDGTMWISSLTRDDTGRGACEVIYVTDISLE